MKNTLLLPTMSMPVRLGTSKGDNSQRPNWELEEALAQRWKNEPVLRHLKKQVFRLHDGPPFANGEPHLGTALNKLLKDFTARSKRLEGYFVDFRPGWDCHGLPTELKVTKTDEKNSEAMNLGDLRKVCRKLAGDAADEQQEVFARLGVSADWSNRYLTMNYSEKVVETFAKFLDCGLVSFARKPVWWSTGAKTALASMELEYKDVTDTAAFVKFKTVGENWSFVAWTTSPWTLLANRAVAVSPSLNYSLSLYQHNETGEEESFLLLEGKNLPGWRLVETLRSFPGKDLAQFQCHSPFSGAVPVVMGQFVTDGDGTGVVHVAPGHGQDDYNLGVAAGLETFSPVDERGCFTEESPDFVGQYVFKAPVLETLQEKGLLVASQPFTHSYPHCWRTKGKVLSRSTVQCFVDLDALKPRAVKNTEDVTWLPAWGKTRMQAALRDRSEWCVSRQRAWGVPVPVFYSQDGSPVMENAGDLARKVAAVFKKHGADVWFTLSDKDFNALSGVPADFTRKMDTLDVWLDSGVSWLAVMDGQQSDLYLEALDQHRGWFQSSLLVASALGEKSPYKQCVTHGWVVLDSKEKMSKSSGNGAKPSDLAKKYGADVVRLWAATRDYTTEMPFNEKEFPLLQSDYLKLRGTLRVLAGNLHGYSPEDDDTKELRNLDLWVLRRLREVAAEVQESYKEYRWAKATHALHNLCVEVSNSYVEKTKDTLYCDAKNSPRRRAALFTMNTLFEYLVLLSFPVCPFLSTEAWEARFPGVRRENLNNKTWDSLQNLDTYKEMAVLGEMENVRDLCRTPLETGRQEKRWTTNGSVRVTVRHPFVFSHNEQEELKEFLGVADLVLLETQPNEEATVNVEPSQLPKCPRCWNHQKLLVSGLCQRCDAVVPQPSQLV